KGAARRSVYRPQQRQDHRHRLLLLASGRNHGCIRVHTTFGIDTLPHRGQLLGKWFPEYLERSTQTKRVDVRSRRRRKTLFGDLWHLYQLGDGYHVLSIQSEHHSDVWQWRWRCLWL